MRIERKQEFIFFFLMQKSLMSPFNTYLMNTYLIKKKKKRKRIPGTTRGPLADAQRFTKCFLGLSKGVCYNIEFEIVL